MVAGVADAIMVGVVFTVTVTVCGGLLHPNEVPVTVYVDVEPGETVIELVVSPVLQT